MKINLVFKDFNSLVGTVPRALASGSGPDVTEGNQGYQTDAQLVKAKLILPLTKYVKKYGWDKLYAPSTWGMFRWTPDGKSFGKGPVWGIAQTGQNVVAFYNKKKLRQLGFNPNKLPQTYAGFEKMLATLRAKLPDDDPVIEEGNKEGYGFIHLFGGIWGAYVQAADRPELDLPRARLALRHAGDDQGAREAPAVGARPATSTTTTTRSKTTPPHGVFAKGKGAMWIGGDWDSTIIKAGLGAANIGVMPIPPGPSGQWASIGGLSGPWHISAKTKYPDLGAEWLNYVITSPRAKALMYSQQQIPSDKSAKAPAGDAVPGPGEQGVPAGRKRRRAPALHRLGLALDVHDAPEPVPAPARRAPRRRRAWRRPSRTTGRSSTRRSADHGAWRMKAQPTRRARDS